MSYIFRLNTSLTQGAGTLSATIQDWGDTKGYSTSEIDQIPPSNPNSTNEPTSIPSPFARIALTKTAFAEVAKKGTNALRAYQQIVSNSLDIGEIFFDFAKHTTILQCIEWDIDMLNSMPDGCLKSTINLFLESDSAALNLQNMKELYFLKHKNTGKIIGGTSPRTLFFSAANIKNRHAGIIESEFTKVDGTFFNKNNNNEETTFSAIQLSQNHFAFSGILPLSQRGLRFQDYLHTWIKTNKNSNAFPEFFEYLISQIPTNRVARIADLPNNMNDYTQLKIGNNIYPAVCGYELFILQNNPADVANTSDFVVQPSVPAKTAHLPLILGGTAPGIENWKLDSNSIWKGQVLGNNHEILPDGTHYSWLTAEDFLEDKIIQLPKPIIEKYYFSGNHTNAGDKCILLPLKDKFFEFFSVEELKKMIRIDGSSSIKVILSIPVKKGVVQFVKDYKLESIISLGSETDFMIFPRVKFENAERSFYRFGLFHEFNEIKQLSAYFYNKSEKINLNETNDKITRNNIDPANNVCTTYALEKKEFDRVKILIDNNISGIIIPVLKPVSKNVNFTFSVDFGTSNTHIAYKTSTNGNITAFDITDQDEQISWLVNPGDRVCQTRLVADIDFIPEHIGFNKAKNIKVKFPTRTALIVANNATTELKLPFAHTNIILPFDKRNVPVYNGMPVTQLKWESDIDQVGYYIDNLCYLMRNKVAFGNGDLANTKIIWTYPLSMNSTRLGEVEEKWTEAYKKYFSEDKVVDKCKKLTESLAPFYYYSNLLDYKDYIKDLVSIDIGGGTTDVVFVKDSKPNFVTSFRFAANDLFGLGLYVSKVVTKYKSRIENQISEFRILTRTMSAIDENTEFGDFASFFFSLKDNEDLTERGKSIDFNKMLKDDNNQKIVFLLFYAAIIYHTAQIMKAKGSSMPRHLTFSGNGSRIVDVVGKKEMLEKIATLIFEKVFDAKYGDDGNPKKMEIIPNTNNPKEVTCEGTIKTAGETSANVPYEVLLGLGDSSFANTKTYSELLANTQLIDKIIAQVTAFFTYVFDELLKSKIGKQVGTESIERALSIPKTAINKAKEVVANKGDIENVVKNKINSKDENSEVEETFFFFAVPTLLRTISKEIENKED
ncbi:MAG: hypothetical protein LBU37_03550 [Tannerellaceae bacterium]|jgi:hypothetical protein|nr:hypothetical protein [Tannerellaceae bacterium]